MGIRYWLDFASGFAVMADGLTRGITDTLASAFEKVAWRCPEGLLNAELFVWYGVELDAMDPSRRVMPKRRIQKLRTEMFFSGLEPLKPTSYPSVFADDLAPVAYFTHCITWQTLLVGRR